MVQAWGGCVLIGVPTGEASGLFVIDVDSARHEEATDWLERWSPHLPETRLSWVPTYFSTSHLKGGSNG
jgi:Bifunctional DNA primase/polymerase, N-terminal